MERKASLFALTLHDAFIFNIYGVINVIWPRNRYVNEKLRAWCALSKFVKRNGLRVKLNTVPDHKFFFLYVVCASNKETLKDLFLQWPRRYNILKHTFTYTKLIKRF